MDYYPVRRLNELTKRIIELMPPVESFFVNNSTILENSQQLYAYTPDPVYRERQRKFAEIIQTKVHRLFNDKERAHIQLPPLDAGLKGGVVDHHGLMNHSVLIGVNITPHYFRMFDRATNGDILTFATGNVPIGDPFHRRGFMIDGKKVNVFSKDEKDKIVYGSVVHDFQIVKSLQANHQWKEHTPEIQQFLIRFQEIIDGIDFSTCATLGDQFTKINFHLWPHLFEQTMRDTVSRCISLEYDDMVIEYLLYVLIHDRESFIYRMLFHDAFRAKLLLFFEGKTGAWNEEKGKGTHFFWGLNDRNEHVRMKLVGTELHGENDTIAFQWNPEALIDALQKKKILPGMLLKFSLLLFYMGLKSFAGYGSGNYLAVLQQYMIEFLNDEYPEEVKRIQSLIVKSITSVPVLLRRGKQHEIENYFAFDIICAGGLPKAYFDTINTVPLKYFMALNLNSMYEYAFSLYGQGEKPDIAAQPEDYEPLLSSVL